MLSLLGVKGLKINHCDFRPNTKIYLADLVARIFFWSQDDPNNRSLEQCNYYFIIINNHRKHVL